MKVAVRIIGSIVVTALMYAVPIITTCSFLLNWDGFVKIVSLICSFGQFAIIADVVYFKTEVEE